MLPYLIPQNIVQDQLWSCVNVIFKYWAGDITQVAECLLSTQDPGFNLQACVSWMWQFIPIIPAPRR